jgi:uncharacterized membrane protein YfcA
LLAIGIAANALLVGRDVIKKGEKGLTVKEKAGFGIIGFVFNFLDTLGIGSFAPTMASLKLTKLVPDRLIPGTLNVSCAIAVATEALIFITIVDVETFTLVSMLIAAIIGCVVGVNISAKLPERALQLTMGTGLAVACFLMLAGKIGILPVGGEALGLEGTKLIIAVCANFVLGLLLPLGIGNYGPCMAIVFLLGMHPVVSFPIMMCSGAFVVLTSSITFTKTGNYHRTGSAIMCLCAVPGVFIAAYLVKSMPLTVLQWLVIVVCVYTSFTLFRAAMKKRPEDGAVKTEKAEASA